MPVECYKANGIIQSDSIKGESFMIYNLDYPKLHRSLAIKFTKDFPHTILAWEERYPSSLKNPSNLQITKAQLTHQIKSAYWSKNAVRDSIILPKLGLD